MLPTPRATACAGPPQELLAQLDAEDAPRRADPLGRRQRRGADPAADVQDGRARRQGELADGPTPGAVPERERDIIAVILCRVVRDRPTDHVRSRECLHLTCPPA